MDWKSAVPHKQWSTLPEGCLGKSNFYRVLEAAVQRKGMVFGWGCISDVF